MRRTTPDERRVFVSAAKSGISISTIVKIFEIYRSTIWRWRKRSLHRGKESFRDKQRENDQRKVTPEVELSILLEQPLGDCKDSSSAKEPARRSLTATSRDFLSQEQQ